jgi:hypothetical protein
VSKHVYTQRSGYFRYRRFNRWIATYNLKNSYEYSPLSLHIIDRHVHFYSVDGFCTCEDGKDICMNDLHDVNELIQLTRSGGIELGNAQRCVVRHQYQRIGSCGCSWFCKNPTILRLLGHPKSVKPLSVAFGSVKDARSSFA